MGDDNQPGAGAERAIYERSRSMVIAFRSAGKTWDWIVRRCGVALSTARRWYSQWLRTRQIEHRKSPGRPRWRERYKTEVKNLVEGRRRRSVRFVAARLRRSHGPGAKISKSTVHNILRDDLGLHPYKFRKEPRLTEAHRRARVAFATGALNDNFRDTMFTDESPFSMEPKFNHQNDRIWAAALPENAVVPRSKHPKNIYVWGGITVFEATPLIVMTTRKISYRDKKNRLRYRQAFDSSDFIEQVLEPVLGEGGYFHSIFQARGLNFGQYCFQQDGDSKHNEADAQKFITDHAGLAIFGGDWPANSPDLNLIENVWSSMKADMAGEEYDSTEALISAVQALWRKHTTPDKLRALWDSWPRRLQAVIDSGGAKTKY
jgi:transposase